jgi:hypothetical protein
MAITLNSFSAGQVIVAADMNTNFDNINSWSDTAALKAGAAFTGNVTITSGTFIVGANTAGDDVKFFGDTSGAYMEWDADTDDLILAGAARVVVPDGQFVLASTAVTSTAAELNILDGVTATTAEINYLDNADLTAADITKLAAITSTAAELNILDGVIATAAEVNTVADITLGTVTANKAVSADANLDVTGFRNVTTTGTVTVAGLLTANGGLTLQDGDTFTFDTEALTDCIDSGESFTRSDTALATTGAIVDTFLQYDVDGGADQGATLYIQASEPYANGAGGGVKGDIWIDT